MGQPLDYMTGIVDFISMETVELAEEHLDKVLEFWQSIEGIGLSNTDSKPSLLKYLDRNPSMSYVVLSDGEIIGTVLCGHDGRRGYIHHLAIAEQHRGEGIGGTLIDLSSQALRKEGIDKCHIFVFSENAAGQDFWRSLNWRERDDVRLFSHDIDFPGE